MRLCYERCVPLHSQGSLKRGRRSRRRHCAAAAAWRYVRVPVGHARLRQLLLVLHRPACARPPWLGQGMHVSQKVLNVGSIRVVQANLGTAQPRVSLGACDGVLLTAGGSAAGAGPGAQPTAGVDPGGGAFSGSSAKGLQRCASTPCRVP